MNIDELQTKMVEEIKLIPFHRLPELYDFIHFFRLGLETTKSSRKDTMRFAGCWENMTDKEFKEITAETALRRRNAFSGRNIRETGTD